MSDRQENIRLRIQAVSELPEVADPKSPRNKPMRPQSEFIFHCMPRQPQRCTQYLTSAKDELNEFLRLCGGTEALFQEDGTAYIISKVKEEFRTCYAKPGSLIRCLGDGQFSAVSARYFLDLYGLVNMQTGQEVEMAATEQEI